MLRSIMRERTPVRLSQSFVRRFSSEKSVEPAATKPTENSSSSAYQSIRRRLCEPNNFDRWLLVWTKKFKTKGDVPRQVTVETLELARNKGRIKFSIYMMLATALGCLFMVWSGKEAAKRGESVHKSNMEWHQAVKEGRA